MVFLAFLVITGKPELMESYEFSTPKTFRKAYLSSGSYCSLRQSVLLKGNTIH